MIFEKTSLEGAFVIKQERRDDKRGFFARVFCLNEFSRLNLKTGIKQINTSFNMHKGTLRGMHYQVAPYMEVKVVRCTRGKIYDVIVDLRNGSETFKKWFGIELSADSGDSLYVPEGFAHGYLTLEDNSEVSYFVSEFYTPNSETGIRYDDSEFGINWPAPVQRELMTEKDQSWPNFLA
jgi:dTDP-4-dehydrorhamnose 3,5-epimerase